MSALRFLGAVLLAGACTGGGLALAGQKRATWQRVHSFCALLEHLYGGIRYQGLPGPQLLAGAAGDERFATFGLAGCSDLAAIPVPAALGPALAAQAKQTLDELCKAPLAQVCAALERLLEQCRERERELNNAVGDALRLYPRLGFCLGLVLVLLLL